MPPVAILFNRIGPYHRARLNAAARRFPTVAVELTSVDRTYAWNHVEAPELQRMTVFPDRDPHTLPRRAVVEGVREVLDGIRPRAVAVNGWSDPTALTALGWCAVTRTSAILMSETHAVDAVRRPWKEFFKRRVIGMCSAALVGGAPHMSYLRGLGMPADRIFTGYDVIDNEHFTTGADAARREAGSIRGRLSLPDHYFLASSRFVEKKNLVRLITAFARFRELEPANGWKLVLLGDGPLKSEILAAAGRLHLGDALIMPGFRQYEELPPYYGLASAFIHASTVEQWGLVVNEAMASGLPVVVSNRCGCAADLVRPGINGFHFDPMDVEKLAGYMLQIASNAVDARRMGEASRRIISEWLPERFGAGLEQALRCSFAPGSPSILDITLLRLLSQKAV
jgi:glycosyltransferase involved in cell wall biosynthesis